MGAFNTHHSFKRIQTELAVNLCPSRHQVRRGASIFPFLLLIDNTIHMWYMQYFFQKKIKPTHRLIHINGGLLGIRTPDPLIKSQLLCQLS